MRNTQHSTKERKSVYMLSGRMISHFAVVLVFAVFAVFGIGLFTHRSSDSSVAKTHASTAYPCDINNDGKIDVFDLSILLGKWGTADATSDVNRDAMVNAFDLSLLLSKWGQAVSAPEESNVARTLAPGVTASSQNTNDGQSALKATDGIVDGYPNDYSKEWVTINGSVGSWIELSWSQPVTIGRVVLCDRPNSSDQVTGGLLTFSDDSTVQVGALNNDGAPTSLTFATRTVTGVRLSISGVSATTNNIGLAEFEVWGYGGSSGNMSPIAHAGVDQSATAASLVTLNGAGSVDPEGSSLTYAWSQISGPNVSLVNPTNASPAFMPATSGVYVFSLIVNDGTSNSAPDTVVVTVSAAGGHALKILPLGDSITESNYSTGPDANGYRLALLNNLSGYAVDYVGPNSKGDSQLQDKDLAGWSGACIKDGPCWSAGSVILYPRTTDFINTHQPDLVIMQGGGNDFCCNSVSDEVVAQRMRDWIDLIFTLRPQVRIILIGTNANYHPGYESLVQTYVGTLKASGKLIEYLPFLCYNDSSPLADRQNPVAVSCPDTVHPDATGYQKLAARLAPLVRDFFP